MSTMTPIQQSDFSRKSSKRRYFTSLLSMFSAVSLDAVEIDNNLGYYPNYVYSKNRLQGGITVRTTTKPSNSVTKTTRGSTSMPKRPRESWNKLLPRNDHDTPENPEDWFYWTSSSDDFGTAGCRKRPKQSKQLNELRAINAPPAVLLNPSPAPTNTGCLEEPSLDLTDDPSDLPLPPSPVEIPGKTPIPTPSIPWIDPLPTASTPSPTKSPTKKATVNPAAPWIDPSPEPTKNSNQSINSSSRPSSDAFVSNPTSTSTPSPGRPSIPQFPTVSPSAPWPSEELTPGTPTISTFTPTRDEALASSPTGAQPPSRTDSNHPTSLAPTPIVVQPSFPDTAPSAALSPSTTPTGPLPTADRPSSPDAPPPSLLPPAIVTAFPTAFSTVAPVSTGPPQPGTPSDTGIVPSTTPAPVIGPSFLPPSSNGSFSPTLGPGSSIGEPSDSDVPTPDPYVCNAIQEQNTPPDLDGFDPTTFGVLVDVQYSTEASIVVSYLDSMNIPVALYIAGCEKDAMEFISNESKRRTLQDQDATGTVQYSQVEPWGVDGACIPVGADVTCDIFGSRIDIFVDGMIESDALRTRIAAALNKFSTLVTDQPGVQTMQVNEIEILNDGTDSGIIGGDGSGREAPGVNTTALIGAVVTGLGVFLLTMIWVVFSQREQRATAYSHARFEDEPDDSHSNHPPLVSSDSGVYKEEEDDDEEFPQYETTIIPVNRISNRTRDARELHPNVSSDSWSPFSGEGNAVPFDEAEDIYWTNHPREGTHQCSAATCEICERRRQLGILDGQSIIRGQFQLQPPPSPERIPSHDPDRWFISGDTVQL